MAQNKKCVLCDRTITEQSPAILTVGAYGNPKCVCSACQELLDTATLGREYEKIADAMDALGKRMAESTPDKQSFDTVNEILEGAAERAKKIKAGEYDFSLDEETSEDEMEELPEELLETEEDRKKDESDEARAKKFDKVFNYITIGVFGAAAILIIVKLITTFLG
ncbi:MAG: hypothetical protein IJW66_05665 [Clostridia bacterium]|nr:hypothetical protein [Clostridia bacterium]